VIGNVDLQPYGEEKEGIRVSKKGVGLGSWVSGKGGNSGRGRFAAGADRGRSYSPSRRGSPLQGEIWIPLCLAHDRGTIYFRQAKVMTSTFREDRRIRVRGGKTTSISIKGEGMIIGRKMYLFTEYMEKMNNR